MNIKAATLRNAGIGRALGAARKLPILPIILLLPLVVWGIFGPLMYPHNPHAINTAIALQPPGWVEGGSWSYLLGTDQLGRDLLSRMMEGARPSLLVSIFGVIFSGVIGVAVGMIAGYFGGKLDLLVMRIIDAWMAIPAMFFMLMLIAVLREVGIVGLAPIVISIAVIMWVPYARIIRAETMSLKEREFVSLAKVTGCSTSRILVRHIFPGVINTIVVMATMQVGGAIMAEAGMSFLGVGVQPPGTAWGLLISDSLTYMSSAWWVPTFAGIAITITVLGANLFGDWLRDVTDPRTKQMLRK